MHRVRREQPCLQIQGQLLQTQRRVGVVPVGRCDARAQRGKLIVVEVDALGQRRKARIEIDLAFGGLGQLQGRQVDVQKLQGAVDVPARLVARRQRAQAAGFAAG